MSLQVWLPLNGTLENKGLATLTSSGTATYKTSGKLGTNCFNLNSRITFTCSSLANKTIFSIAFWAKVNDDETLSTDWVDIIGFNDVSTGGTTGQLRWETCYSSTNKTRGISGHDNTVYAITQYSATSGTYPVTVKNIWEHRVFTVSATKCSEYINGELKATYNVNGGHLNGTFWIGQAGVVNGEIQDVRIYDHCLSEIEVKQLSQGLMLHYPLNNNGLGNENLLLNTNDLTLWDKESGVTINWDSNQQMYKMVVNKTNNTSRWGIYQNFTVTPNTTYTFSVEGLKGDHTTSMAVGTAESSIGWPANRYTFKTIKTKGVYTFTSGVSDTVGRIYLNLQPTPDTGNKTAWFLHPKLELGDKATPWCPNVADVNNAGLDGTIEYDCSGFGNNGIKIGTLNYLSDTPKYTVSLKITTTSTGIKTSNFYVGNIWTMSVWFKYPSLDNTGWKALVILNNYGGDADIQLGNYFNCNDGRIQYSANGKYNSSTYCTAGVWHHLVNVYDGTVLKGYLDGVQKCTITPGQTLLRSNLGIGLRSTAVDFSTTSYSFINGQISDVRIYATALSEKDVKSLYNNNAYIDSDGKIYGKIR